MCYSSMACRVAIPARRPRVSY
ncbi:TPA: hypothetical protein N0F65_010568 [Lagenidium giganteum]|uniref:Uncharacterized protein n=1 Tax=Lagenidium giganteum TaxID=4803 RepID=A0AAV2ZD54_9STRA|nr:TPA: hypothetical protein N0F65_010568 [Lagenidium giganteum]